MARVIPGEPEQTAEMRPYAEDNLLLEDVLAAVNRGLSGNALLEHLAEVAGARFQPPVGVPPGAPARYSCTFDRANITQARPEVEPRGPFDGPVGAYRYFAMHGRARKGQHVARHCLFRDPELFLSQVEELVSSRG